MSLNIKSSMKKYLKLFLLIPAIIIISGCGNPKFGEPEQCTNLEGAVCKTECSDNETRYINGECEKPYPIQSCCVPIKK